MVTDYREINQANWDDRVPTHLASDYYSVQRYLAEPDFMSDEGSSSTTAECSAASYAACPRRTPGGA